MVGGAGGQMLLGIVLEMDASGVVTGASLADEALDKVKNKATEASSSVQSSADNMAKSVQAAGGLMAAGIATAGIGMAIEKNLVEPMMAESKKFQLEMAHVGLVSHASAMEMEELRKIAISTAASMGEAPEAVASGMKVMLAAGLDTKTMLTSLDSVLQLVKASRGELNLETAAEANTTALLKFQHAGESTAQILDHFATAADATKLSFRDLPIILNSMGTAAADLKMSSSEAFAVVGALTNVGQSAAQAGNSVMGFSRRMVQVQSQVETAAKKAGLSVEEFMKSPPDKMPKVVQAFTKFGVSMFDAQGNMRSTTDVMSEFVDASKRLTGVSEKEFLLEASAMFGQQAKAVVSGLAVMKRNGKEGGEAFKDLVASLDAATGSSKRASDTFMNTALGQEKVVEGLKATAATLAGEEIIGFAEIFTAAQKSVLTGFIDMAKASPKFAGSIAKTTMALGLMLKVLGGLMVVGAGFLLFVATVGPSITAAGGAAAMMGTALGGIGTALGSVAVAMLPVLGMILLAAAAFFALRKAWQDDVFGIQTVFGDFGERVKLIWQGIIDFWDGEGSADLLKTLDEKGLLKWVVLFLQVRDRIVAVWKGITLAMEHAAAILVPVFTAIVVGAVMLLDVLRELWNEVMGTDISTQVTAWQAFGYVIGALAVYAAITALSFLALPLAIVAFLALLGLAMSTVSEFGFAMGVWLAGALESLGQWFINVGTKIAEFFVGLKDKAFEWGSSFFGAVWDGMKNKWESVKGWFTEKLASLRAMLPGSDAETGPLSDLTASGQALMTTFHAGMTQGAPMAVQGVNTAAGQILGALPTTPILQPNTPTAEAGAAAGGGAGAAQKTISVIIQKLELLAMNATPEEAERLATMVLEKIAAKAEEAVESAFA